MTTFILIAITNCNRNIRNEQVRHVYRLHLFNMSEYDDLHSAPAGDFTIVTSAYRVKADFRLFHEELEPERVTEAFGLCPTVFHRRGDQRTGKAGRVYSPYSTGSWVLSSEDKIRSLDANDHIRWVLCELAHCTGALHQFQDDGYVADIVCAWFAESDNTCPNLTAETIRQLALFRVNCWFDVYLFPPDE